MKRWRKIFIAALASLASAGAASADQLHIRMSYIQPVTIGQRCSFRHRVWQSTSIDPIRSRSCIFRDAVADLGPRGRRAGGRQFQLQRLPPRGNVRNLTTSESSQTKFKMVPQAISATSTWSSKTAPSKPSMTSAVA
jgi:hypothetical protein